MLRRPPRSTLFPTRRSSDLSRTTEPPLQRRDRRAAARLDRAPKVRADRKSTRLNSSHVEISYAVFCLKKKNTGSGPSKPGTRIAYSAMQLTYTSDDLRGLHR